MSKSLNQMIILYAIIYNTTNKSYTIIPSANLNGLRTFLLHKFSAKFIALCLSFGKSQQPFNAQIPAVCKFYTLMNVLLTTFFNMQFTKL